MTRGKKKKPFQGKKVYFSGSIRGSNHLSPKTYNNLINFMKERGADILTEFVGANDLEERNKLFSKQVGKSFLKAKEPWILARKIDFQWVDEAEYLVAEVTSPSIGVGMEIQRAKDKKKLGFNHTKILCLCRQRVMDKDGLSWMIKGVTSEEHKDFYLVGYKTLLGAKKIISRFLTNKLKKMKSLPRVTIAFVIKNDKVLLGMKKRGFGEGKWNGSGGKAKEGEEIEEVMKREMEEEFNITPTDFERVAEITFVEPSIPGEGIWVAHVFLIRDWSGEVTESEEMKPQWFPINKVPYQEMWASDALWLPRVLKGEKIKAKFTYGKNKKIKKQEITPA